MTPEEAVEILSAKMDASWKDAAGLTEETLNAAVLKLNQQTGQVYSAIISEKLLDELRPYNVMQPRPYNVMQPRPYNVMQPLIQPHYIREGGDAGTRTVPVQPNASRGKRD